MSIYGLCFVISILYHHPHTFYISKQNMIILHLVQGLLLSSFLLINNRIKLLYHENIMDNVGGKQDERERCWPPALAIVILISLTSGVV